MPSYLVGAKEAFVPTQLYQPNFEAISGMMRLKQGQYDAGFDAIKSTQSAVMNAALTKDANVIDREKYLKTANEQLKNLSSVDLSISQNVTAGKAVYKPFYDDDDIVQDIMYTKKYNDEVQGGLAMRDSKDEDVRAQYWGAGIQNLQNQAEKVKNSQKGDMSNYVNKKYVPFKDPVKHLEKAANAQGLKIINTEDKGPYLVEIEGGAKAAPNYEIWAKSQFGPEFDDIWNVLGQNNVDGQIKEFKAQGLDDSQAKKRVAGDFIGKHQESLKKSIFSFTTVADQIDKQQKALLNKDGVANSPEAQFKIDQLEEKRIAMIAAGKEMTIQLKDWSDPNRGSYKSTYDDIIAAGPRFFGNNYKDAYAQNWAAGRAAISQVKILVNPAYKNAVDNELAQAKYQLDAHKEERETQAEQWKQAHPKDGSGSGSNGNGGGSAGEPELNADGTKMTSSQSQILRDQSPESGQYIGPGVTNIATIEKSGEVFRQGLKNDHENAQSIIYSAFSRLVPSLGIKIDGREMTTAEAIAFGNEGFELTTKNTVPTNGVYSKVVKHYKDQGKDVSSPYKLRHVIQDDLNNQASGFAKGTKPLSKEQERAIITIGEGESQENAYAFKLKNYNSNVSKVLSTELKKNPALARLVVTEKDGNNRFRTADDIVREDFTPEIVNDIKAGLKSNVGVGGPRAKHILTKPFTAFYQGLTQGVDPGLAEEYNKRLAVIDKLTPKELAEKLLEGSFTITPSTNNLIPSVRMQYDGNTFFAEGPTALAIGKKYAGIKELTSIKNKAHNQAEDASGSTLNDRQVGHVMSYAVDDKKQNYGFKLLVDASNRDNRAGFDIPEEDGMLAAFASNVKTAPNLVSMVDTSTITKTGKRGITFKFNPTMGDQSNGEFNYVKMGLDKGMYETIKKNGGLTMYVSDNAKGEAISKMVHPSDSYVYGGLLKKQVIHSSPIQENMNYKYTITPDNMGSSSNEATTAIVDLQVKKFDPVKKEWSTEWEKVDVPEIALSGPNKKSPDEIKAFVDSWFANHIANNNKLIGQVYNAPAPAGHKALTLAEIREQAKQKRLLQ